MNKRTYKMSIEKQKREKKSVLCCSICGEDNPNVIEMHHIDGRNNSDSVVPLCKNCHFKVTAEQNKVSPKDRSGTASPLKKRAYNLITQGILLKEMGEKQIQLGHEFIQDDEMNLNE